MAYTLKNTHKTGFTIVELLIVIVVIAVLSAITVVAYNSIQARAHDSAVQNDFKNIAKQFELYKVDNGVYPAGDTQLSAATLNLRVAKNSYGNGMISNTYNLLYCRAVEEGPTKFALVAGSKSGKIFTYLSESGVISSSNNWPSADNSQVVCQANGIAQATSQDRDFFYISSSWRPYTQ